MVASTLGDTNVVSSLLELGADVNKRDSCGWTALQRAIFKGHSHIVDLLRNHQKVLSKHTGKPTTILLCKI